MHTNIGVHMCVVILHFKACSGPQSSDQWISKTCCRLILTLPVGDEIQEMIGICNSELVLLKHLPDSHRSREDCSEMTTSYHSTALLPVLLMLYLSCLLESKNAFTSAPCKKQCSAAMRRVGYNAVPAQKPVNVAMYAAGGAVAGAVVGAGAMCLSLSLVCFF